MLKLWEAKKKKEKKAGSEEKKRKNIDATALAIWVTHLSKMILMG